MVKTVKKINKKSHILHKIKICYYVKFIDSLHYIQVTYCYKPTSLILFDLIMVLIFADKTQF